MYDEKFSYTPEFITKNGEAFFPFMGEIHYSRYNEKFWKESLLKMKAGGVNIVSSYTIWIHHEEVENEWDFSGQRNLRKFVGLIKECGMYMILRIGPWSHAEVRNGGFPDWLLHKGFEVRANNEPYFAEVKKFYSKIYEQVDGFLLKDGGPIIGVQIENEFGHCGGLTGEAGEEHMTRLKTIAKEAGFDVPLYTATGWGGAITAGMLPVMGGYVDAPWDQRATEIEPSGNFVITYERNDHNIGSDFGFCTGITFDIKKYPYLTAELGGGLQPTFLRRPVPTASDIGAEALVKMASGVSLLGYYMYHGGTNPKGKLTTLQESKATGSLNDLCELNYDFFAPIGEYGQISPTYGELKLYSLFAADFGPSFCKMKTDIPSENPLAPEDTEHLRYSFRYAESEGKKSGYIFVNNYVRHQKQKSHKGISIAVPESDIRLPALDINDGDYFFLPFNMEVGDAVLKYSLASPLCILDGDIPTYVFYKTPACRGKSEDEIFVYRDDIPGKNEVPTKVQVLLIEREDALNAFKVQRGDGDRLYIFEGELLDDGKTIYLRGKNPTKIKSIPESRGAKPQVLKEAALPTVSVRESDKKEAGKKFYEIKIGGWQRGENCGNAVALDEVLLNLYYNGSYARLYKDGALVADNLFCKKEIPWQIGLRFFDTKASTYELEIQELKEGTPVYLEDLPEFKNGSACDFVRAECIPLYKSEL